MRRLYPVIVVLSTISFFLNMGCHTVPTAGEGTKEPTFVGKLEPSTLTLRPGAAVELRFTAEGNGIPRSFYTGDVVWSMVELPSYSVGTIANSTGQAQASTFVLGKFQAAATLPSGVERVTFKVKAGYLTGTSVEINATATVTLDVNAPTTAPLEIPASLTPVLSPALGPELPPGTTPNPE